MRFAIGAAVRVIAAAVAVSLVAQLLIAASPGRAGERAARAAGVLPPGDSRIPGAVREQLIAEVEARHGLDRPLASRMAASVARMATGDLGRSWRDARSVSAIAAAGAARTLPLILVALVLAAAAGIGVAGWLARRRGVPAALTGAAISLALVTPPVWLALMLLGLGTGAFEPALAALALAVLPAGLIARHAGAVLDRTLAAPWAIAARARGVPESRLVGRYGLREIGAEIAPLASPLAGYLLGAAMVVETVFGIRGIGAELAASAGRGDAPVVVGLSVVCALVVALAGVAGQIIQRRCDPRLRGET